MTGNRGRKMRRTTPRRKGEASCEEWMIRVSNGTSLTNFLSASGYEADTRQEVGDGILITCAR